jgi:uncharacterized LabA/DUF88 family protein
MGNYAFIDGQNVHLGVKSQGWLIDWIKFRVYLKENYAVTKAFFFIGYVARNESLYEALRAADYILVFKPTLEIREKGEIILKGNVDAELVLQAMIEYPNYDQAVIISGDGDFYCLVRYLRTKNKLRVLLVPNMYRYSALLKRAAKKKIASITNLRKMLTRT